ncbi:hypothetical protein KCP75_01465 [Salmonella enterica subsp. enterica]|nr:hypothetical protein KCP75_01465 [Salmonella enterica subsp. enterica]
MKATLGLSLQRCAAKPGGKRQQSGPESLQIELTGRLRRSPRLKKSESRYRHSCYSRYCNMPNWKPGSAKIERQSRPQ